MGSPLLGTYSMASQLLFLSPSLSFSHYYSVAGVSLSSPPAISVSVSAPPRLLIYCGKGDRKTAKGKRFSHSFGNARPRNKKKGRGPPRVPAPPKPKKEPFVMPFEDGEDTENDINDE